MGKKQMVNSKFWDVSDYIKTLSPNEKLIYLYCLTNPVAKISGIYQRSIEYFTLETGLKKSFILKTLEKFTNDRRILYQDNWVCIRNRHEFNNNENPNIEKSYQEDLDKAPDFIRDFLALDIPYIKGKRQYVVNSISKSRSKSISNSNPDTKPFIHWYAKTYEDKKDMPYKITWAKEGKIIKDLLKTFSEDKLKIMAAEFLSYNKFAEDTAGYTINIFACEINKYTYLLKKEKKQEKPINLVMGKDGKVVEK